MLVTVARNLDNLGHHVPRPMFGSCFIEAALLVLKDWKVLRPLHQAFSVPVQLTATAEESTDLALVSDSFYIHWFLFRAFKVLQDFPNEHLKDVRVRPSFTQLLETLV
jgi:hypothetical protein